MHWTTKGPWQALLGAAAFTSGACAGRGLDHIGKPANRLWGLQSDAFPRGDGFFGSMPSALHARASPPQFLNSNTSSFSVNGSGIPDVAFDIGESYAGSLPLSSDANDTNRLFFWFFPSTNPDASDEILIWLNGGPGCSSLAGLLQENGPFLWQPGTFLPVPNTWAWTNLTNIVYIEQPVGTGFSVGTPTATNEEDVADQFLGFWKNFVDTFSMQGYKVYIAGESYAGMYCPYIANAMLNANDTTYYNVSGVLIYDPVIGYDEIQTTIPAVSFVDFWSGLFPFNDSFSQDIHSRNQECGFADYVNKYLVYPPAGEQPTILPGQYSNGTMKEECASLYMDIALAALSLNPCWDVYQVAVTCPVLWDVLGFPGTLAYLPAGAQIYFDRADVKKAINAPENVTWNVCNSGVFNSSDTSLPSGLTVLPQVIDATQNVIIGHGALDYILLANGTLLTIQNMTWGGKLGFQSPPTEPLFIPLHDNTVMGSMAGAGVMGTVLSERGLTYAGVDISGHMVPQYAPSVAYRQIELLLGRIPSLTSTEAFTTDSNVTQPDSPLGNGTAPQGYVSNSSSTSSAPKLEGSWAGITLFLMGSLMCM